MRPRPQGVSRTTRDSSVRPWRDHVRNFRRSYEVLDQTAAQQSRELCGPSWPFFHGVNLQKPLTVPADADWDRGGWRGGWGWGGVGLGLAAGAVVGTALAARRSVLRLLLLCGYPYYGYGYDYPRAIAMFVRPAGPSSGHMRITRIGTSKDVGAVSSGAYNRSTGETAFPGKRKPFVSGFDG